MTRLSVITVFAVIIFVKFHVHHAAPLSDVLTPGQVNSKNCSENDSRKLCRGRGFDKVQTQSDKLERTKRDAVDRAVEHLESEGLPGWAIALIVIGGLCFCGVVAVAKTYDSKSDDGYVLVRSACCGCCSGCTPGSKEEVIVINSSSDKKDTQPSTSSEGACRKIKEKRSISITVNNKSTPMLCVTKTQVIEGTDPEQETGHENPPSYDDVRKETNNKINSK